MTSGYKRPPLREHLSLFEATIAREGVTTAAGAGAGTSIIDAALIGFGANSFFTMLLVLYPGQQRLVDSMDITAFNNATGEITYSTAYKGVAAAIPVGVPYTIVTFRFVPAEVVALQADVTALMADIGDASASTLGSILGILGDPATTLLAQIIAIQADVGDPTGETLATLTAKWGDIARSLDLILGARWDGAGDLGTDIAAILVALAGAAGIFNEQADVAVTINAINGGETDVFDLNTAATRYVVRNLRLKAVDPGANTITVRLYELINDVSIEVDSFEITTDNFGSYHTLMDMFGVPYLAGDDIQVTVRVSAGGPYAMTGQYSHGKTNV